MAFFGIEGHKRELSLFVAFPRGGESDFNFGDFAILVEFELADHSRGSVV